MTDNKKEFETIMDRKTKSCRVKVDSIKASDTFLDNIERIFNEYSEKMYIQLTQIDQNTDKRKLIFTIGDEKYTFFADWSDRAEKRAIIVEKNNTHCIELLYDFMTKKWEVCDPFYILEDVLNENNMYQLLTYILNFQPVNPLGFRS